MGHVGSTGNLEGGNNKIVATASAIRALNMPGMTRISPAEAAMIDSVTVQLPDGTWAAYHIASVRKVGDERLRFVATDGSIVDVDRGVMSVVDPSDADVAPGGRAQAQARDGYAWYCLHAEESARDFLQAEQLDYVFR